jgi:hypothetical protein
MLIEKCLVLSTGHLSPKDVKRLDSLWDDGVLVMKYPEGFNVIAKWPLDSYKGFSPSFKLLLKLAKANDCKWLLFDRDGEVLEGYKVYEW